jgi:hypothetical protein
MMTNLTCFDDRNSSAAIKPPCRAATSGNIALSGLQTIDGVALQAGDRVLVKAQTGAADNGIRIAATGAWQRSLDFLRGPDAVTGTLIAVTEGIVHGGRYWKVATPNPFTIGSDALAFAEAAPAGGAGGGSHAVASRTALAAIMGTEGDARILTEAGREGTFRWSAGNHSGGALEISNHSGTTVSALGGGWFGIEKTGGVNDVNDAGAVSSLAASGRFLVRARQVGSLQFFYAGVSLNPTASAGIDIGFDAAISGSTVFVHKDGSLTLATGTIDRENDDFFLYRNVANQIAVLTGPQSLAVTANNIEELIDLGFLTLVHTYAGTHAGSYKFDSSAYKAGSKLDVQFLDLDEAGSGMVAADPTQSHYMAPASDPTGASGAWVRETGAAIFVPRFGTAGDGEDDDTDALYAASSLINALGGGELVFRGGDTHLIGRQIFPSTRPLSYAVEPAPVLHFTGGTRKLTLIGNGVKLLAATGLKYGGYHPTTGLSDASQADESPDPAYTATPFHSAILCREWLGDIEIDGFEIDGRIDEQLIGGGFSDAGIQINNNGIAILSCSGKKTLRNLHVHHMGQDGIIIRDDIFEKGQSVATMAIDHVKSENNGRQGLSIAGAKGLKVSNSQFNYSAVDTGAVTTLPASGVDCEPDGGTYASEIEYIICEFVGSAANGYLSDSGRTMRVTFRTCRFVASVGHALWVSKPGHSFYECTIVGAANLLALDTAGEEFEDGRAPQFFNCYFTDDPDESPDGDVYAGANRVSVAVGAAPHFHSCEFDYIDVMGCPGGSDETVYHDCILRHALAAQTPQGKFFGKTVFEGDWNLLAGTAKFYGPVFLGGVQQFVGSKVHNWPSLAAGAVDTTTVTVPGARVGDGRRYRAYMSVAHQGVAFDASPSADNTVLVSAINPAGAAGAVDLASATLAVDGA